jgi:tetratricopeptide (TPR) repeat protein
VLETSLAVVSAASTCGESDEADPTLEFAATMTPLFKSACCAVCLLAMHSLSAQDSNLVSDVSAKQEYWARFDHQDWAAAIEAAEILVATARKNGAAPAVLAEALEMLGDAQLRNADLAGAEASFKEALDLIEAAEGRASGRTLAPLRGLGFALAARNRHAEAVPFLDRALLISHRTHGLFHEGQQPILKQLANSLMLTGQPLVAERHVKFLLQVGERTYGQNDPRLVPLMCEVGDWQTEVGNFDKARRHYRDAIRLVEEKLGKEHVAIVLPLRRLAASYPKQFMFFAKGYLDPDTALSESAASQQLPYKQNPRHLDNDGQRALLRALEVLNAQTDPPQQLLAGTLIDLGNWYQFKQDWQKALPYYQQAAQILAALKREAPDTTPDPLAVPLLVYYPVPHVVARGNSCRWISAKRRSYNWSSTSCPTEPSRMLSSRIPTRTRDMSATSWMPSKMHASARSSWMAARSKRLR